MTDTLRKKQEIQQYIDNETFKLFEDCKNKGIVGTPALKERLEILLMFKNLIRHVKLGGKILDSD